MYSAARKHSDGKASAYRRAPMGEIPVPSVRRSTGVHDVNNLMASMNCLHISSDGTGPHPNQAFYSNPSFVGVDTEPKTLDETMAEAELERELKALFDDYNGVSPKLPAFVRPAGLKESTKLHPHQEDGIRYLLENEVNPKPNPFYRQKTLKDGTEAFYDLSTNRRLLRPHGPTKGSILADGKKLFFVCLG